MFLDEIAAKLVSDGVGVLGTSIFKSSAAIIPTGNGPYLTVSETGGMAPSRKQNQTTAATQRPTAQILVRAATYASARAMSKAAYNSLDGVTNTVLSGVFYLSIRARQEPTDMGADGSGRFQLVFNIEAEKAPS